jgi:hypothetical protein
MHSSGVDQYRYVGFSEVYGGLLPEGSRRYWCGFHQAYEEVVEAGGVEV